MRAVMAPVGLRLGARSRLRSLALLTGGVLLAALSMFHVRLLWLRVASGSILDASVCVRWGFSALLLVALLALRRHLLSLTNARHALVFWLLVAALHWNVAPPETLQAASDSKSAVQTLFLLPAAGVVLALVAVLGLRSVSRRRSAPLVAACFETAFVTAPALRAGWGLILAPRPPPA
jgi:hypothetical protein